ncbi:GH20480 [Drosophila grimshawi]|uniref:GH20480 n=1 Tax=Drosophila grimshawi TaxID=7222 RepID=B4J9B1_DROGR|nr:GH20480 [Drosophila grimshawi]
MKTQSICYSTATVRSKIETGEFKVISKRSRSRVWNVFSRVVDKNGTELRNVVCRSCPSIFKFHGSTSNLVRHKCYRNAIDFGQTGSDGNKRISSDLEMSTEDQDYGVDLDPLDEVKSSDALLDDEDTKGKLAQALAEWAVENCRALDIFEDTGLRKLAALFIELGAYFGTQIKVDDLMPQTAAITANIYNCYQDKLEKVRRDVCVARINGFSITCNTRTDNSMENTQLCLTMHYIKDGKLFSRLLTVASQDAESCTGSLLKTQINTILSDFQCVWEEDKPIFVTSSESIRDAIIGEGQVNCISKMLGNVIESAFKEVDALKDMLNQAKELVKYMENSGAFLNLETPLVNYSPNEWKSIYHMLKSIESHWTELINLCGDISGHNQQEISSVVNLLGHFEKCCRTLEDENLPTLHLVIPHLHRLRKQCSQPSQTTVESNMKLKLMDLLESLVQNHIVEFHKMAMFLFPPTNQLLQCTRTERNQTIEKCRMLMKRFCPQESSQNCDTLATVKQEVEDDLFSDFVTAHTPEDMILKEIRRYSDLQVPLCDGYNVLNWWYFHKDNFPLLYPLSCRILGTPASSAASEKQIK